MSDVPQDRFRLYQQDFPSGEYAFFQLAFVVDDLVSAARRWVEAYGIGPFFLLPRTGPLQARYRGEPSTLDYQIAVTQAGPVQIEFVQQFCDNPSVYRDIYQRGEHGAHHICTVTSDFDTAVAHYERLGYSAVTELDTAVGRVCYFDTTDHLGLVTEVIERNEVFMASLAKTARVCARWDGTDPIRVIRPGGGYDVPTA